MRRLWKTSLGLTLGLLTSGGAHAGEPQWQAAPAPRPAVVQDTSGVSIGTPMAALGRPVARVVEAAPAPAPAILDSSVRKASFSDMVLAPVALSQLEGTGQGAKPMPAGPSRKDEAGKKDEAVEKGPKLIPEPSPVPVITQSIEPPGPVITYGTIEEGVADGGTACGHRGLLGCWLSGDESCDNNRFYIGAEYLLWKVKGAHLPPLVTTGSVNDAVPGALGQPAHSHAVHRWRKLASSRVAHFVCGPRVPRVGVSPHHVWKA